MSVAGESGRALNVLTQTPDFGWFGVGAVNDPGVPRSTRNKGQGLPVWRLPLAGRSINHAVN
jgi:hypothetical protein